MSNWIGKIIYILFIGVVSFYVITLAQAAKVLNFMAEQEDTFKANKPELIQSFVISYFADGTNAYVLEEPLYNETFVSSDNNYEITLSIYNYVIISKQSLSNSLAFIIDDVKVNNASSLKDEHNRPLIDARLMFSEPIIYNSREYSETKETFVWMLGSDVGIFLVNYELLKNSNGYVDISGMEITYRIQNDVTLTLLNLGSNTDPDLMDRDNRSLDSIKSENINLVDSVGNNHTNDPSIYFNGSTMSLFRSYNKYYFTYIGTLLLFVIPITYFGFFHKVVWRKYKEKKRIKEESLNEFRDKLKEKR